MARQRRSSEEVRSAILQSARELFDSRGYQATTMGLVSENAGVSKRLIFSNFGSKAELFTAAVTAPFSRVVAEYVDSWLVDSHGLSVEQRVDRFVNDLYGLAHQHRRALLTAVTEMNNPAPARDNVLDELARSFQQSLALGTSDDLAGLDIAAMVPSVIGMIVGAAVLDPLFFPSGTRRPSRKRITDEMRTLLIAGVLKRDENHSG
ncbi:TetR/AcrR family transcriptional regulator [Mycobacterium sp.]|uniref:TetR/AcrR family transcriptional regulator n=1 Tax=Mycobacterium sp. TaxID=1785 RepID=UPI0025FD3B10|nr:TetR/AcrR family transcriptional regulator [Mycobacterium sp.]